MARELKLDEYRRLSEYLLSAQEEERQRLGRLLHDDLGQRIAALQLQLEQLRRLAIGSGEQQQLFEVLHAQTVALAEEIQAASRELYPSVIWDLGLLAALRSLAAAYEPRGLEAVVSWHQPTQDIPFETALAWYRICEELFAKCGDQASCLLVRISVGDHEGAAQLTVQLRGLKTEMPRLTFSNWEPFLLSLNIRARMVACGFAVSSSAEGELEIRICRSPRESE